LKLTFFASNETDVRIEGDETVKADATEIDASKAIEVNFIFTDL
jgi:hypothetical protein